MIEPCLTPCFNLNDFDLQPRYEIAAVPDLYNENRILTVLDGICFSQCFRALQSYNNVVSQIECPNCNYQMLSQHPDYKYILENYYYYNV